MPLFLDGEAPIGQASVLRQGTDVALLGTGTMTYQLLMAAEQLAYAGVRAEVVHFNTIKPLDEAAVVAAAQKCGRVVTAEEGQITGGFGSAVAEVLSEKLPVKIKRIGVRDQFGESGSVAELWQKHGLDVEAIVQQIKSML